MIRIDLTMIPSNLISVKQLHQLATKASKSNLVILDATMKKKPNGDPIETPLEKIPNALAFDFDTQICDKNSELPHMLPALEEFEQAAKSLGINTNSTVVVYDAMGIFSSPRAWWMFKVMGHKKVLVLNGGLPQWIKSGYQTETQYGQPNKDGNFESHFNANEVVTAQQVLTNIKTAARQVMDARSLDRFSGEAAEPRASLKRGHIPSSLCLPFTELLEDGLFKDTDSLKTIFSDQLADNKQFIFSCGSGVTACILALAADQIGIKNYQVYDGSWSEWGAGEQFPHQLGN